MYSTLVWVILYSSCMLVVYVYLYMQYVVLHTVMFTLPSCPINRSYNNIMCTLHSTARLSMDQMLVLASPVFHKTMDSCGRKLVATVI